MKFRSASCVALLLLFHTTVNESRSYHGIGARVEGDKLLANNTKRSPTRSPAPSNHSIEFAFPLNDKLVSYIELTSESNVHAEVVLNHNNILHGKATAIEALDFELTISIYGIDEKDAPADFHPVLTPERPFEALMMPYDYDYEEEDENFDWLHNDEHKLPLGERQPGDALVYKTYQHSDTTKKPGNHSVVFYYIDSYYLTCAQFYTIQTETATATFSHTSDHSIKAVIYDTNVKSLDVRFQLYGYRPDNKPDSFRPLLPRLPPLREEAFIEEAPPSPLALECPPYYASSGAPTRTLPKMMYIIYFLIAGSVLKSLDGFQ